MADRALCDFALLWYPHDSSLWIGTCRNIQCDVIQISQLLYCAVCWLNVAGGGTKLSFLTPRFFICSVTIRSCLWQSRGEAEKCRSSIAAAPLLSVAN